MASTKKLKTVTSIKGDRHGPEVELEVTFEVRIVHVEVKKFRDDPGTDNATKHP